MQHTSVVIANGQATSDPVELWNNAITAIHMPTEWTAADLTLLASAGPKGPYQPVHDAEGDELTITTAASRVVVIDAAATRGMSHIKLRSGSTAAPVNQGAARTLRLMLRDDV